MAVSKRDACLLRDVAYEFTVFERSAIKWIAAAVLRKAGSDAIAGMDSDTFSLHDAMLLLEKHEVCCDGSETPFTLSALTPNAAALDRTIRLRNVKAKSEFGLCAKVSSRCAV